MVKNPPADAGDTSLIPGPGYFSAPECLFGFFLGFHLFIDSPLLLYTIVLYFLYVFLWFFEHLLDVVYIDFYLVNLPLGLSQAQFLLVYYFL